MSPLPHRASAHPADEPLELTERVLTIPASETVEIRDWAEPPPAADGAGADGRRVLGWTLAVLAVAYIAFVGWRDRKSVV